MVKMSQLRHLLEVEVITITIDYDRIVLLMLSDAQCKFIAVDRGCNRRISDVYVLSPFFIP
jgi:hypothetical protein